MANFDIRKRNQVIRKYCPELFEKEPPPRYGKLLGPGDVLIEALALVFNAEGRLTDAWIFAKQSMGSIFTDDEQFKQTICMLRDRYHETDTVVFDVKAISCEAGRDMLTNIFHAGMDRPFRFRGMTQQQIAHALLASRSPKSKQPTRRRILSVTLEEFFDGNHDDSSINPNSVGTDHPGIDVFRIILGQIHCQPEVLDVRIGIHEWPFLDETDTWMIAKNVYIWCHKSAVDAVKRWVLPLKPDFVISPAPEYIPANGPTCDQDTEVLTLVWD